MPGLPGGTVTFLFTDIEGSTRRWESSSQVMQRALARHDAIMRDAIEAEDGHVFKTVGDAFCAAFAAQLPALQAALSAQKRLQAEDWGEAGPIKVRMALHTGAVESRDGDYFGQPLNRIARLLSVGHGGQVLLSNPTFDLLRDVVPAEVSFLDMGEHRLKDLLRPERIHQLVAPGLPSDFPPLRTLDNYPNNLPRQTSTLVGREKEVQAICALVRRPGVALLTLTGPGGTGKTRLALQAVAEMLEEFAGGVWFVELAALTDHRLVLSAIASTLGVKEQAGQPLLDTLSAYLKEREILLVLDNMEQVVEAAPQASQLLVSCPQLKIIATSRLSLRVRGEHEYPVPPLQLPDLKHLPALERITQYEAVRLFIDRATEIKPDFQVTNDNAPAVAEICARLDGLPLAIELAAARVRMLPPHALLGRLSTRLKVLTGGARDLPARQQTLRNTIEWSYDLLNEGEKQLFRRMAVFQGGRTLEGLEAVCNYDGQLQADVFDGVQSLLEKNLLQQREGSDGEPRFWMLETIHEYAWEKLQESGEAEALRKEHTLYFVRLSEEAEPHLTSQKEAEWLSRLEDEHDNLLAALQWVKEKGSVGDADAVQAVEVGLRTAGAIWRFWYVKGYFRAGREQLSGLLSLDAATSCSKRARVKALSATSWLGENKAGARSSAEQALAIARELGDKAMIAQSLNNLGNIAWQQGNYSQARSLHEQSLTLRREIGDRQGIAASLLNLANLAINGGDYPAAHSLYAESQVISRELGNKGAVAITLTGPGLVAFFQQDYSTARLLFAECLALGRDLGDRVRVGASREWLANVECRLGNYAIARSLYEESLVLWREAGIEESTAINLSGFANIAGEIGQPHRAARLVGAAEALNEAIGKVPTPVDRASTFEASGISSAHTQLGQEEFERAIAEGRAMSMEEAIQYALKDTGDD